MSNFYDTGAASPSTSNLHIFSTDIKIDPTEPDVSMHDRVTSQEVHTTPNPPPSVLSHSTDSFPIIRSRQIKSTSRSPPPGLAVSSSNNTATDWYDGFVESYGGGGPSRQQIAQPAPVSFTDPSRYALSSGAMDHWQFHQQDSVSGTVPRRNSWNWPADEGTEMGLSTHQANAETITYHPTVYDWTESTFPAFNTFPPPPAHQQINSLYENIPPPPTTYHQPHPQTALATDIPPQEAFIPSSNLPASRPMQPVTTQSPSRRCSHSPKNMREVNENAQELIDTILAQTSIDMENAREQMARKDEEIVRLKERVRELEESEKGKGVVSGGGEVGDEGLEMETDAEAKAVEAGPSSTATASSDKFKSSGFVHKEVSEISSDYLARLSYGTMEADELRRWVQILIGRVGDLEKLVGLQGEKLAEAEEEVVQEDEDVEMDGNDGVEESREGSVAVADGDRKRAVVETAGSGGESQELVDNERASTSPALSEHSPVVSHASPQSIPDSPMKRLRITSPDRQSEASEAGENASSGDEWVRL